jgi:hypothetical protein
LCPHRRKTEAYITLNILVLNSSFVPSFESFEATVWVPNSACEAYERKIYHHGEIAGITGFKIETVASKLGVGEKQQPPPCPTPLSEPLLQDNKEETPNNYLPSSLFSSLLYVSLHPMLACACMAKNSVCGWFL